MNRGIEYSLSIIFLLNIATYRLITITHWSFQIQIYGKCTSLWKNCNVTLLLIIIMFFLLFFFCSHKWGSRENGDAVSSADLLIWWTNQRLVNVKVMLMSCFFKCRSKKEKRLSLTIKREQNRFENSCLFALRPSSSRWCLDAFCASGEERRHHSNGSQQPTVCKCF